jgi:hypothetical protein
MSNPEETLMCEEASVSLELTLPKSMVPALQSAFIMAGETEGYLRLNDLLVEAIHQEIQRLNHSYNSERP